MKRVIKSISFREDCPIESQLLEHAVKHSNFAAYIKRLIQRDMEGGVNPHHIKKVSDKDQMSIDDFF